VNGQSETISWKEGSEQYRRYLFVQGSLHTKTKQPAFDPATAQTVELNTAMSKELNLLS
jgi:hypothetical protein